MTLIGYARVSTADQDPALQLDALAKAGCERVFEERASGARSDRPVLADAMAFAREGDTLVVWQLDRFGRSLKDLISRVAELEQGGAGFLSLTESIDTTTAGGRLVLHMFGALAEFEREPIRERTVAGLKAARARGGGAEPPPGEPGRGAVEGPRDGGRRRAGDVRGLEVDVVPLRLAHGGRPPDARAVVGAGPPTPQPTSSHAYRRGLTRRRPPGRRPAPGRWWPPPRGRSGPLPPRTTGTPGAATRRSWRPSTRPGAPLLTSARFDDDAPGGAVRHTADGERLDLDDVSRRRRDRRQRCPVVRGSNGPGR